MHDSRHSPRALVVLGMHRSGTSALTGVLHLLGVELGSRLIPAQVGVNDRGFWEHAEIVAVHDRLLHALDSSWDDVCPLPAGWWRQPVVAPFREEIVQIVRRDFAPQPLWSVKDPRLCRLLPLWIEIFAALGCDVSCVLITRNPHEVAQSLAHRDGFAPRKAYVLWLTHVLDAARWTQTFPRVWVTYEALLADWRTTVERLATTLSVSWPRQSSTVASAIEQFLDPGLRHYRHARAPCEAAEPTLAAWVSSVAAACHAAPDITAAQLEERLAPVRRDMTAAAQLFGPWVRQQSTDLTRLGVGFSQALETLAERDAQLAQANAELRKVGAGFAQALQFLAERDAQLAQANAALSQVGADLAQAWQSLAEREAQLGQARADLSTVNAELASIRAHWVWRVVRTLSRRRKA